MKQTSFVRIGFDLTLGGLLAYYSVDLASEVLLRLITKNEDKETKTDNE